MPINETLSQYSDWLYTTAAAIYVVALMMTLVEQGFGAKGRLATERAQAAGAELVGAGGPPVEETGRPHAAHDRPAPSGSASMGVVAARARRAAAAVGDRAARARRAPRAVGQHVRVRHGGHLHHGGRPGSS